MRAASAGPRYRRGQVEWALWRWFAPGVATRDPPAVFRTRIRRLVEIDRYGKAGSGPIAPDHRFAFLEELPDGRGKDVVYTDFNAVCLGLGLDMLDAGFAQLEVVFVLLRIRGQLEHHVRQALERAPKSAPPRAGGAPRLHAMAPEDRVFLLLDQVAMKEQFGATPKRGAKALLPLQPPIIRGFKSLTEELKALGAGRRRALIFEIASPAAQIAALLEQAPVRRRGRPSA